MIFNIEKLVQPHLRKIIPYQSARRIGGKGSIWLNANESPFSIENTIKRNNLNRYPECQPKNLILKYASYSNVNFKNILVTRGSDEGIDLLSRTFCIPEKDSIMIFPPTYDMYSVTAKIMGINVKQVPLLKNWDLDILNIKLHIKNVKIIYLCRPNNPTGNCFSIQSIKKILEIAYKRAIVVVDEAYIEFCYDKNISSWIHKYSHLVILRTLSKAFSLAGLRCGFLVSNKKIIKILSKIIPPYPISIPTSDIAEEALSKKNIDIIKKNVVLLNQNKNWLIESLKKNVLVEKIYDSDANYILVKFYSSHKVFTFLWNKGIILRDQSKKTNLKRYLRISIGTKNECLILIKSLNSLKL
ncbi:histidinol-phosphate transaminase [Buchnera aphidicola]|uniref:histidinol-phosphate transaminase n=1 Tax=Buchnera aphidicola TaxID=9 RepID=UPI0031B6EE7B